MTQEKKIKGRKRHILVDTQGLLLASKITAANLQDSDGLILLLDSFRKKLPRARKIWADMGYRSKALREKVQETGFELDIVQRSPKWITNPKLAKDARAEMILELGLHEEKRGFYVLPRRWVVERTFAWLNKFRRLSKQSLRELRMQQEEPDAPSRCIQRPLERQGKILKRITYPQVNLW